MSTLSCDNIVKDYPGTRALDHVSASFDSGKINGTSYGSGALIGGTGYGAQKITINGGRLNLDVPHKDGWASTLTG